MGKKDEEKKIINWYELSRQLTGSVENIRADKPIPQKHEGKINELLEFIKEWRKKHNV